MNITLATNALGACLRVPTMAPGVKGIALSECNLLRDLVGGM
jgi:hypothetical protein